jgi:hypothetical protein
MLIASGARRTSVAGDGAARTDAAAAALKDA